MRRQFRGLLAGSAVLVFVVLVLGASSAAAKTVNCLVINDRLNTTYQWNSKKDVRPLQTAIDAADPGDTLWIRGECFGPVTITKSLTLTGQAKPGFNFAPQIWGVNEPESAVTVSGSDVEVQLNSLTIQGGGDGQTGKPLRGGGIYNNKATLILNNVTVSHNYAREGAGIYTLDGSITLDTSAITNNRAGDGGGVYADGSTIIANDSEISGNVATTDGGGISTWNAESASTITLTDTTINDNKAGDNKGGGIDGLNATVTLDGSSELAYNNAGSDGGGAAAATMIVSGDATIHDNTAGYHGGGVYAGDLTLSGNAAIYNNDGPYGGGVNVSDNVNFNVSGHLTMNENATIHDNTAVYGGGLDSDNATATLAGSAAIYNNHAYDFGGGTYGGALIMDDSAAIYQNTAGIAGGGIYSGGPHTTATAPPTDSLCPTNTTGFNVYCNTPDNIAP